MVFDESAFGMTISHQEKDGKNGLGFDLLDLLPVHYYVEDLLVILNTCPRIK